METRVDLRFAHEHPFNGIDYAAVALQVHAHGFHVGVLHRESSGDVKCLHLEWHLILSNDVPVEMQAWIQPPYPKRRLRSIAAYCRRLWNNKSTHGIKYGFRYVDSKYVDLPRTTSDKDKNVGKLLLGPTEHGFTCATFVLVLFRAAGVELVDVFAWPSRDVDRTWQERMISSLRRHRSPEGSNEDLENHLRLLESEIGCARFRPEEVAAAASRDEYPVHHETAWKLGNHIASTLQATA